jgi:genome maintenance exonuclease 1
MTQKLFEQAQHKYPVQEFEAEMIDGVRYYNTPSGNKYPSVTTILSELTKKHIAAWREKVGQETAQKISTQAARRGTNVHKIAEKYMLNDPLYLSKDTSPLAVDMFKQIQPIIDRDVSIVYGSEMPLYSDYLRTAGRSDLFCQFQGTNTILDFKTASKPKKEEWIQNYFLQCTTYAIMIEEMFNVVVPTIAVVIAVENDSPQLFVKKTRYFKDEVIRIFVNERSGKVNIT